MLNISKSIYAGWNTYKISDLFIADICPIGDSSNEKRKINNFTKTYPTVVEFENIPLPGFTLLKSAGYKSDLLWLIIDPRGFLTYISSQNLENILKVTGITEGLIQEKCVWVREDSRTALTLVPVSSPEYLEVVENTNLLENKVKLSDVGIGDTVILQNGLQGEYMGVLSLYGSVGYIGEFVECQSFLRRQIVKIMPGKYFYHNDAKILKVINKSSVKKTKEDSANEINNEINSGNTYFTSDTGVLSGTYYSCHKKINYVSEYSVAKPKMDFIEIDKNEAATLLKIAVEMRDRGVLIVERFDIKYIIGFSYNHPEDWFSISEIDKSSDGNISCYHKNRKEMYQLDSFSKYYKIVKHVKNGIYI
jgi:hypothetical protein